MSWLKRHHFLTSAGRIALQQVQKSDDLIGNAGCRLSVPQLRNSALLAAGLENVVDGGNESIGRIPHKGIGAVLNGCRSFGVLSDGKAGHAERGGFFLHPTAVGDGDLRITHQPKRPKVAQRRRDQDGCFIENSLEASGQNDSLGSRMQREHEAEFAGDDDERFNKRFERCWIVDVGGAVQGL